MFTLVDSLSLSLTLVEHTRFICGNHVLDINESVLATVSFEYLKRFVDQIANVLSFLLTIIDSVTQITF